MPKKQKKKNYRTHTYYLNHLKVLRRKNKKLEEEVREIREIEAQLRQIIDIKNNEIERYEQWLSEKEEEVKKSRGVKKKSKRKIKGESGVVNTTQRQRISWKKKSLLAEKEKDDLKNEVDNLKARLAELQKGNLEAQIQIFPN